MKDSAVEVRLDFGFAGGLCDRDRDVGTYEGKSNLNIQSVHELKEERQIFGPYVSLIPIYPGKGLDNHSDCPLRKERSS